MLKIMERVLQRHCIYDRDHRDSSTPTDGQLEASRQIMQRLFERAYLNVAL